MPRNSHLASDFSLTCNHSSCHTFLPTSTTFDSKFSNHGVAANKPTHTMTMRLAAFSTHQSPRGCSVHSSINASPSLHICGSKSRSPPARVQVSILFSAGLGIAVRLPNLQWRESIVRARCSLLNSLCGLPLRPKTIATYFQAATNYESHLESFRNVVKV